jgi:hypothetical protein
MTNTLQLKLATQFQVGSRGQLFHLIQLKQDHHLDLTRATAVPHANLVDTRVTVMKVSISTLSELFRGGYSGRQWTRKSLNRYVRQLRSTADSDIICYLLWLRTQSDGLYMKRTSTYMVRWSIVHWLK